MKPQRFDIGQAVTLRSRPKGVTNVETRERFNCPLKPSEIYHISAYEKGRGPAKGEWYVFISEHNQNQSFNENGFEPVLEDGELTELLEESFTTQPQTV